MPSFWCAKYPTDIDPAAEWPFGCIAPPFARKADIVAFLAHTFPHTDASVRTLDLSRDITAPPMAETPHTNWILITESDFTIQAILYPYSDDEEWCREMLLGVTGEDTAVDALRSILQHFDLRAYDRTRKEFFDLLEDPACRFREERLARERYKRQLYNEC